MSPVALLIFLNKTDVALAHTLTATLLSRLKKTLLLLEPVGRAITF